MTKTRKRKIMMDLDVVTVGKWDRSENGDIARGLMSRIERKEFYLVTPFYLLEHVTKWKNQWLRESIEGFYIRESHKMLTSEDIDMKIEGLGIDDNKILKELQSHDIKEEDAFIVLVTSLFALDYLITFNRKHLRNKKETINEVLQKNGAKSINIIGPEEA